MKAFLKKPSSFQQIEFHSFLLLFCLASLLVCPYAAASEPAKPEKAKTDRAQAEPIHISSDRLLVDNAEKTAEFSGNVKATQDDSVILSDRLKISYKDNPLNSSPGTARESSIKKIEAFGNVRINFDNSLAAAEHAVYTADDRVLVLSGPNAFVNSNGNTITGERITVYRDTGQIIFENEKNSGKRVEAVIKATEGGLD